MAGHSHWSKIKRAKGANDAKRGKIWSKIARKIIIAAKGGGDPRDNLSLRYVIDEAKAATTLGEPLTRPDAAYVRMDHQTPLWQLGSGWYGLEGQFREKLEALRTARNAALKK